MGFKLAEWAMSIEAVKGWSKAVLVVVAVRADDKTGECFPSQKTLAAASGASVATVNRSLDQLEAMGLLTRARRSSSFGYRSSDLITLDRAWIPDSQVGTEPSWHTANLADSKSLDITLQKPNYHGDSAEGHSDDHSVGHSDLDHLPIPAIVEEPDPANEIPLIQPTRSFAEFWLVWPRKVGKPQAKAAWDRAVKRADPETIYEGARAYRLNPHLPEKQFIPHPTTWLNRDGWDDELPGPTARSPNTQVDRNLAYVQQLTSRQQAIEQSGTR